MPDFGGGYAMNPAVAKAKASAADNSNDNDGDELIPDGHKLTDGPNVSPADNGYSVRHSTEPIKIKKGEDRWQMRKEHHRVFENKSGAAGHVLKVLSAHEATKK